MPPVVALQHAKPAVLQVLQAQGQVQWKDLMQKSAAPPFEGGTPPPPLVAFLQVLQAQGQARRKG